LVFGQVKIRKKELRAKKTCLPVVKGFTQSPLGSQRDLANILRSFYVKFLQAEKNSLKNF
jgi:hypothetical protein